MNAVQLNFDGTHPERVMLNLEISKFCYEL